MAKRNSNCPDCGTRLQPIQLIDATEPGLGNKGLYHVEPGYAAPDSKRSFFTGTVRELGKVKGEICPACGRILLFGVAKESN